MKPMPRQCGLSAPLSYAAYLADIRDRPDTRALPYG